MTTVTRKLDAMRPPRPAWAADVMSWIELTFGVAERSVAPLVDLLLRLWLAQIFFVSGVLKGANFENALALARYEYPVSWMDPLTAAYLGVTIELLGSVLLALGLATRFAALSMLVLSLVIQFNYQALDTHLFWVALFAWFTVCGAGSLSLDHILSRGLADSALPLAARGIRLLQRITKWGAPAYKLWLRLSIALTVAAAAFGVTSFAQVLPIESAAPFATGAGLLGAALLAVGLGTRAIAIVFLLFACGMRMMGAELEHSVYWLMLFALLALYGPGSFSLDKVIASALRRIYPQLDGKPAFSLDGLPRVVIVGAGFGGLTCAAKLARAPVQVTLVDRHNYHLFQPLLYQVATTALSPGDIATPVRGLFRDQFNVRVLLGAVTGVDTAAQQVLMDAKRLPYDYLVLATGAAHSYFGRDEWEPYAPGLKRVEDATEVRRRLLIAFERAEATEDPLNALTCLRF